MKNCKWKYGIKSGIFSLGRGTGKFEIWETFRPILINI